MIPNQMKKLDLKICKINIGSQKIDGSILETFEILITNFQLKNKASKTRLFQKTFFIGYIKFNMISEMLSLKINNANM